MAESKKTAAKSVSPKQSKGKSPVKKTVKPIGQPKRAVKKTEVVDEKALAELNKAIEKSMQEAEKAVKDAIKNAAEQSDYTENYSE